MTTPYSTKPDRSFWRPAVASRSFFDLQEVWRPKLAVKATDAIVTFGSCFAQHIGRALVERGFNWHSAEPRPPGLSASNARRFNYDVFSARTGNIYTTSGSSFGTDEMNNVILNNRFGTGVGVTGRGGRGLPATSPGNIPSQPQPGLQGGIAVPNLDDRLNVNLPVTNPAGSFGLAILGADYLLDLELSAAQTEGRGEVVSTPRVITASQKEADIKQGQEVGYVTFQSGGTGAPQATVNFKEAVLELKVTPTITADDRVYLDLNVKKDAIASFIDNPGGGQVPQLDKREINTSVLVDNGQTVVLGGVYEVNKTDSVQKVPYLGDVPILGNLFKFSSRNNTKAELLIFVTPRILNDSLK